MQSCRRASYAVIIGITTLFSGILFMFTALILSFAVLHAMRRRRKSMVTPALPVKPVSVAGEAVVPVAGIEKIPKKHYRRPVLKFHGRCSDEKRLGRLKYHFLEKNDGFRIFGKWPRFIGRLKDF